MSDKIITPGALLIKEMLPTEAAKNAFDTSAHLNKNNVNNLIVTLLKHGGPQAYETINKLGQLFFNKAYEHGYTTPISDYINDSAERTALIKEFEYHTNNLLNDKSLGKAEKMNKISDLATIYQKKLEVQNITHMVDQKSTAAKMALTGARGNPGQLQQGTSTPLMGTSVSGIIPLTIRHSYAEGMTAAEQTALSYGGRSNTISAQTATSLPGALFKRIAPTVFHEVITETDCKTTNGVDYPIKDKKAILGKFEAGTNRLVTDGYYKELQQSSRTKVKVRNTMTCEAHDGLCQKCYGLMANGHVPEIGENVGVIAAQSASETLTQAVLSTKHTGGTAGKKRDTYSIVANLLKNPENFQDEAAISPFEGKVAEITKTALNDHEIHLEDVTNQKIHRIFVPRQQDIQVSKNEYVKPGERLSTGTINPRQLAAIKGVGAARRQLSTALRDAYGGGLDPRHFDILAKNLAKHVEVIDPGTSDFVPGERVTLKKIQAHLEPHAEDFELKDAAGKVLARNAAHLTPGTRLGRHELEDLKNAGISKVHAVDSKLEVRGYVPGLERGKLLDDNFISRMAFNRIKDTAREAAALGHVSEIHSTDPLTSYVLGNEFGQGENGKY